MGQDGLLDGQAVDIHVHDRIQEKGQFTPHFDGSLLRTGGFFYLLTPDL